MDLEKQPISNIEWIDARRLNTNDYNPNVVLSQEMKLLKFSMLENGWIQPVLISKDKTIIDGFHRYWLAVNDAEMIQIFDYQVPVCIMNVSTPERMLLTIRINRAKGNHVAFKMQDIVKTVHEKFGFSKDLIGQRIGAGKDEIDLLLQEGVYSKLNIKNHKYSMAWIPKT